MIYDTLHHRKQYQNLHPGVAAALDFLADTDWAEPVSYTHLTLPTKA